MEGNRSKLGFAAFVIAALSWAPYFSVAQTPPREGNIWGGVDHEPVPSQVQPQERAAGVSLPRAERKQQTDEVERLYRNLLQSEGQSAK